MDEIEGHFKGFKPKTYDVGRQVKAIEAFEAQAMKGAQQTREQVDREVQSLEKALRDIETARPFEDLTVVCLRFFVSGVEPRFQGMVFDEKRRVC